MEYSLPETLSNIHLITSVHNTEHMTPTIWCWFAKVGLQQHMWER